MTARWLPLLAFLAAGCEGPVEHARCGPGEEAPIIGEAAVLSLDAESEVVTIIGTAEHLEGLAIRRVQVANVIASPFEDAFNYSRWSVTIPLVTLRSAQANPVRLQVTATDSCDRTAVIDRLDVELPQDEGPVVESLSLDVLYPPDRDYLPATRDVSAVIVVEAPPEAAGADVTLESSLGVFRTSNAPTVTVQLDDDGEGAAAFAELFIREPGTALVTAQSQDRLASALVVAEGPRLFAPNEAILPAGTSLVVELAGDAELGPNACSGTGGPGVVVTSSGIDLLTGGTPVDTNGNGLPDFRIEVAEDLLADTTVSVVCSDVYGQVSGGNYEATLP